MDASISYFFQYCGRFVDCTHKNSQNFCVFVDFPFISYGWSFMTEEHNCDFFFYDHLACSNQALNFFVCSHSKCHKSHQVSYHSDEAVIFKNSKQKIFRSKVTEEHQGCYIICVCVCVCVCVSVCVCVCVCVRVCEWVCFRVSPLHCCELFLHYD